MAVCIEQIIWSHMAYTLFSVCQVYNYYMTDHDIAYAV